MTDATHHSVTEGDPIAALVELAGGFVNRDAIRRGARSITAESLPPRICRLLVHHDHMTTVLEEEHGGPVRLQVLKEHQNDHAYSRMILLYSDAPARKIEFGIVRIDLDKLDPAVRTEIVQHRAPLGDILIRYDVLRRIEPHWFFEFTDPSPVLDRLGPPKASRAFGRYGTIYCNHQPTIDLLEIVPEETAASEREDPYA